MRITPNAFDLLLDGNTTEDECSCGGKPEDFDNHGIYACWNNQRKE